MHASCATSQILNGAEVELRPLPLGLGAKRLREGLTADGDLGSVLLEAWDLSWCLDQAHGELVALHQERSRVRRLRLYSRAEAVESILRYHSRVVEPLPVGLDTGDRRCAVLVDSSLGDVSLGIALGFAICEALEELDLFRVTTKLSVYPCMSTPAQRDCKPYR